VDDAQNDGIKEKLQRQGEEALGRLAEELAGNPLVTGALQRAFEAREKAVAAQNVAMGALNLPSAADIERLTRRLRSVSQRLEGIEDSVDRLDERLESIERGVGTLSDELAKARPPKAPRASSKGGAEQAEALEGRLEQIGRDIEALRRAVAPGEEPPPRAQERLSVSETS
jgi:septal ring factor EnvC (AmiA/AmiB activator)